MKGFEYLLKVCHGTLFKMRQSVTTNSDPSCLRLSAYTIKQLQDRPGLTAPLPSLVNDQFRSAPVSFEVPLEYVRYHQLCH